MSETIKRVAQAINLAAPDDVSYNDCWDMARAAIAAMREPTSKMIDAGDTTIYPHRDMERATEGRLADQPWRAMIDAALKEK